MIGAHLKTACAAARISNDTSRGVSAKHRRAHDH
jgi:hypothetical protein